MPEAVADLMFWVALVCCAVAQVAIIRSVFIVTPAAATGAEPGAVPRRATELAWALLPAVVLGALFWVTWRAMHTHTLTDPGGMMHTS